MASGPDLEGAHRRAMAEVEQELTLIGLEIEAAAVRYLQKHNIQVTGDLTKSVRSEVERELGGITLRVGTNLSYAVYVHEGTKPHWPPPGPIRRWVRKKLNLQGKELQQRVYLVRRKIGLHGTKAKPFMAVALRLYRNRIARRVAAAIERGQGR